MSTYEENTNEKLTYNQRFANETVNVRVLKNPDNRELGYVLVNTKADDVPLGSANAFLLALAILSEVENLEMSTRAREKELLKGYNSVISTVTYKGVSKSYRISVREIAQEIVALYDDYKDSEFIDCTLTQNCRYSSQTEEGEFDLIRFSNRELYVTLGQAEIGLLVKGLRLYIMGTVKNFFPYKLNPSEWNSSLAVYKARGISRSTVDFVSFVDQMIVLYDHVTCLSPRLDEFRNVVTLAINASKKERSEHPPREREPRDRTYVPKYKPYNSDDRREKQQTHHDSSVNETIVDVKETAVQSTDARAEVSSAPTKQTTGRTVRSGQKSYQKKQSQDDEEGWTKIPEKKHSNGPRKFVPKH